MIDVGADVAIRLTGIADVLVEHPHHAEVAAVAAHVHVLLHAEAVGHARLQHRLVLEGGEHAVANAAGLAGDLGGAKKVCRLRQAVRFHVQVVRVFDHRRTADTAGVEHARRGALKRRHGASRAGIVGPHAGAAAAAAGARRCGATGGGEDLAALQEEQALLREIGLARREIDDHIIGLHRAEIRQSRGG